MSATPAARSFLLSTAAIRERCANVLTAVEAGQSNFFTIDRGRLDACARKVVEVTLSRYPDLRIPYHSRWRHFEAGGVDRYRLFKQRFESLWARPGQPAADSDGDPARVAERARAEIDLAVVSVLLDAGAGAEWHYVTSPTVATGSTTATGATMLRRSEGLGVASFDLFMAGAFSSQTAMPLRADATGLGRVSIATIERGFQVRQDNPLIGVAGRVQLLQRLGEALSAQPQIFGVTARPGGLYDSLAQPGQRKSIKATDILHGILTGLASIWPAENRFEGHPVGDCWPHRLAGGQGTSAGWVPIHKLSQWLTYSLLEPFERAGIVVTDLDDLTALAEYRNGGLLLDLGVIRWRDAQMALQAYRPADEAVIEWRALTLALMPALADAIRQKLKLNAAALPLAKILEGGTWAAGRVLAQERRGGLPPFNIVSDGTVF